MMAVKHPSWLPPAPVGVLWILQGKTIRTAFI
jgi:hypothetical protein